MGPSKLRVLFVASHPVQYAAPLFRLFGNHSRLDPLIAYCSLHNAEKGVDPDFGVEVAWDIPLMEGYPWVLVPNRAPDPGIGRFWGLFNPGLWRLVRKGNYDAVVVYTGYAYSSFWVAAAAAKLSGIALLFGTDAHELRSRDGSKWKACFKSWFWPRLFRFADIVIVPSTPSLRLMQSLGIPPERVVLTPYVVANDWWLEHAARVDRATVRRSWGVPEDASVVLFCGKLQPWKRPMDLLHAFATVNAPGAYLVFAGDGPLRGPLEAEAAALKVAGRVRFLGFRNQSQLPAVYRSADLFVLPSGYEAFGVVVNEAMLCGCAVAVSDCVGAGHDLVRHGQTGFIFPAGDVAALTRVLRDVLRTPKRLRHIGEEARRKMEAWSPRDNIEATVKAIELAVLIRSASLAKVSR